MTAPAAYTPTEMMTIVAARALGNSDVCFVGIGAPSAACNLARLSHAPDITLIYESGTLATKPSVLPLSIGDGELCETALSTVPVVEMFQYWLQGGRVIAVETVFPSRPTLGWVQGDVPTVAGLLHGVRAEPDDAYRFPPFAAPPSGQ